MRILLLFVFSGLSTLVAAQTQSLRKLPKPARALLEDYVLIPSGTVTMNIFDGYDSLQCRPPARKSVSAFYMSKYEITVAEYRQFFQASGEPENRYDTTVWTYTYFPDFSKLLHDCSRRF